MARLGGLIFILVLVACTAPSPLPDMQPGETGRVVRIIDGDALVLESGQSVRLVSIEAPALYPRDREPDPYAAQSARALEDMALGRRVQLFYPGLTRDRYDRALAHAVTIDGGGPKLWLNQKMIEQGAAWVRLYPDTAARGGALIEDEAHARANRVGIWGTTASPVIEAAKVSETDRGFRLVKTALGEKIPVPDQGRFAPICIRELSGTVLRLHVRRDAATACGLPTGTQVLIRGYVANLELDLSYPRHLEVSPLD